MKTNKINPERQNKENQNSRITLIYYEKVRSVHVSVLIQHTSKMNE